MNFSLQDGKGHDLVGVQNITATRTLTLNPTEVLEGSNEVATIQMSERDMTIQMLQRLNSQNVVTL